MKTYLAQYADGSVYTIMARTLPDALVHAAELSVSTLLKITQKGEW